MKIKNNILLLAITTSALLLTSCYSVFSGGTGGSIVDAESTSSPKDGIADVDVYAYTDSSQRDSDFSSWTNGTTFTPSTESYYGHTTTDDNGDFTISKLVWKNTKPTFGKDADTILVYLLFYHENYGLTKGTTLIVSDSTSDTIYQELTASRKTTTVSLEFYDVASNETTSNSVYVTVTVPQTTEANTTASSKKYRTTVSGTGTISVSYPRWQNDTDKTNEVETKPSISINYVQNVEDSEVTWKACNSNKETGDYSFISDPTFSKTISGDSYTVKLYGKATVLSIPTISGQYNTATDNEFGTESDDGVTISMKAKGTYSDYLIDCGETTTASETVGTSSTVKHGVISGLGENYYWEDTTYTGTYSTTTVAFYVNGSDTIAKELEIKSNTSSYTVQLP